MAKLGYLHLEAEQRENVVSTYMLRNKITAHKLAYAGLPVFPCRSADIHGDGRRKAKSPYTAWKEKAHTSQRHVGADWDQFKTAIPGIHLAKVGLVVIDLDRHGIDGVAAWQALCEGRDVPEAPMVHTPGGGVHIYFRQPDGEPLGNSEGDLPKGINVRGSGGFVIGPHAELPDGRKYEFAGDYKDLLASPVIPAWLVEIIRKPRAQEAPQAAVMASVGNGAGYWGTAFWNEIEAVRTAPKGGRNNRLNISAFRIGQMIQKGEIDRVTAETALMDAAQHCGLRADDGASQCLITIRSGIAGGIAKPRADPVIKGREVIIPQQRIIPEATLEELDSLLSENEIKFDGDPVAPPLPEIVEDLLPRNGTGMLGGQSSVGKSFLVCDLAVAITSGQPFFGKDIQTKVGVFILSLEGETKFRMRLDAAKINRGAKSKLPIAYKTTAPDFSKPESVNEFLHNMSLINKKFQRDFGVPLGLIIIDTVAKALVMKDEDDADEVTAVCKQLESIGVAADSFMLGVKHYGKDVSAGMRGSSAWRDNVDIVIAAMGERDQTTLKWKNRRVIIDKARDAEDGLLSNFELDFMKFGTKPNGKDYGTMTVRAMLEKVLAKPAEKGPTQARLSVHEAIKDSMKTASFEYVTGDGEAVRAVTTLAIKQSFASIYPINQPDPTKRREALRKAYERGFDSLLEAGIAIIGKTNSVDIAWLI